MKTLWLIFPMVAFMISQRLTARIFVMPWGDQGLTPLDCPPKKTLEDNYFPQSQEQNSYGHLYVKPSLCQWNETSWLLLRVFDSEKKLVHMIREPMKESCEKTLKSLRIFPIPPRKKKFLRLGLKILESSSSSSSCAKFLLEESLLKEGIEVEESHGLWFPEVKARRSQRHWNVKLEAQEKEIFVKIFPSESLFGRPMPALKPEAWGRGFLESWSVPVAVQAWLKNEETFLDPNILPKTVYKKGAWIYLDRGRGWGLKLRDRLISSQGSQGHVIRFYGYENSLDIAEGAILFVREGLEKVQLGDSWHFDPQVFPTP